MKKRKSKNKTFRITQTIYVVFDVEAKSEQDALEVAHAVINDHSVDEKLEPKYHIALTQANFDLNCGEHSSFA